MRLRMLAAVLLLTPAACVHSRFDADFTGATLRVDYSHSGTAAEEHLALERIRAEGPWPGSRTQLLDPTNLGKYLVEVIDRDADRVLYSRGFCSIFGEWETTGPARDGTWNTIPESVRLPEPRRPFHVRLSKRDRQQTFREIWSMTVDPAGRDVDRAPRPTYAVWELERHGPPRTKVDIVILGDGYTAAEERQFRADAKRLTAALFSYEPFASRRRDFNVRAVWTPAMQSGVTKPDEGVDRDSPLGATYCAFGTSRYALTFADRAWRDAASAAPYDFVIILLNETRYGAGGIHNTYVLCAARADYAPALLVHEFGHHIAGLADEYCGAEVAYEELVAPDVEPWEPNVTALLDPQQLKWRDLVAADTPLPTPWNQSAYERLYQAYEQGLSELQRDGATPERVAAHRAEWNGRLAEVVAEGDHAGKVGAFEGAMYQAKGLYRPCVNCVMRMADSPGFCPVCRRAIERVIELNIE